MDIQLLNNEEFRPIPFASDYLISNYGRVYSTRSKHKTTHKDIGLLKCGVNNLGYNQVTIILPGYVVKRFGVHRLVAITWIDNPDNLPEVNHKDINKTNNQVSNLEWVTHSANIQHSYNNGRKAPSGTNHYNFGKKVSQSTLSKMSEAKQGKRRQGKSGKWID